MQWLRGISLIDKGEWNNLADPLDTPLLDWDWLRVMEASGSMTPETGWLPLHLTVWKDSHLIAAAPLYVKSHSAGEFVYDHVWADVADQLGTALRHL